MNNVNVLHVWKVKSKRYSPARGINTYQLMETMKENEEWEHAGMMAEERKEE